MVSSGPPEPFATESCVNPNHSIRCGTCARISELRSPVPAVDTIASLPPMLEASATTMRSGATAGYDVTSALAMYS